MNHIAIIGSRSYPGPGPVAAFVARLPADAVVVSGGAPGVDSFAEEAARACGLETVIFDADWERLGWRAGPIRNERIIAHAERVVAFWNGRSRGTLNALVLATRASLPIEIYDCDGSPVPLAQALDVAEELGVFASIEAGERRAAKLKLTAKAGDRKS